MFTAKSMTCLFSVLVIIVFMLADLLILTALPASPVLAASADAPAGESLLADLLNADGSLNLTAGSGEPPG